MSLESQPSQPVKAYSYLRCSTPEQMQGDTFRRQLSLAESYVAKRGWELDRTLKLHDMGVSAFRGRNLVVGNLGQFLEHVRTGEVQPGSVLLVESLDRLSRQEVATAQLAFLNLLSSGVNVVTLFDETEYSWESVNSGNGMVMLIVSLTIMSRAHEESDTKSRRLKAAWSAKREAAVERNVPLTGVLPAWLRLNRELDRVELIPERAAIVERIFQETLSGFGQHHIAARLNAEGLKPWGRGAYWQRSYIAKILINDATIGTMTPHTLDYVDGERTRTPQDPIKGYFPAAISEELFLDVQAMKQGKVSPRRGRHAAQPVTQMLARLATCPVCGGSMARVNKGSRSRPSLVCARARTKAGCTYKSVRIDQLEEAIAERLPERLRDAPAGERNPEIDRQVINVEAELERVVRELENVERAIREGGEAKTLVRMMRDLEGEYEEARDTLRRLEAQRAEVAGQTVQSRIERLLGTLEPQEGDPLDVAAINAAMLTVFKRVTVDYPYGVLEFEWLHGGSVELPYALPE